MSEYTARVSAFTVAFAAADFVSIVSDFEGFAAESPPEGTWDRQTGTAANAHTAAKKKTRVTELLAILIGLKLPRTTPETRQVYARPANGSRTVSGRTSVLHLRLGQRTYKVPATLARRSS